MFTGIVEELGEILGRQHYKDSIALLIRGIKVMEDIKEGDSIAVNGVCLTVAKISPVAFYADVMPETLRKTNLHELKAGEKVNLERALTMGGRLGGHFVSGHIDGTGIIISEKREGNAQIKIISAGNQVTRYVLEKGSIAIDGVSLTVVNVDKDNFSVSLIPHTAKLTTLGYKKPGDRVNLEADMLGKYVEKLLLQRDSSSTDDYPEKDGITSNLLKKQGFL
ncbi:MAG: riboflavin synthase [Bacillota bacterium]|nr:riboflavin synthase [Bacillota bacterium]